MNPNQPTTDNPNPSAEKAPHRGWLRRKRTDLAVSLLFLAMAVFLVAAMWDSLVWFKTSPPYVDRQRYPVMGIDISSHNGEPDLTAARADGAEFVFIKASEGEDFQDPGFKANYKKALGAGMKVGAYHFFRFDKPGIEQAKNLLRTVGIRRLDLGLAIDVEEAGNAKGVPDDSIVENLSRMAEYLHLRGCRVVFYSNKEGYFDFLEKAVPGCPLWICSFNRTPIEREWTFWQFNHHGKLKGMEGDVDLNVFNGNRSEWERFLGEQQYPPAKSVN